MPSYFVRFGPLPIFSAHAWRRLLERGLTRNTLDRALVMEPKPGDAPGTVIYSDGRVTAVVNMVNGRIITVWWTP